MTTPGTKPSAKWTWTAIAVYVASFAAGVFAQWFQSLSGLGGEGMMAAAYNSLIIQAVVYLIGLPIAVVAFRKERGRKFIRGVNAVLYALPLTFGLVLVLVYFANVK